MGYTQYTFPTFEGDLEEVRWNQFLALQNDLLGRSVRFCQSGGGWSEFVVEGIKFPGEETGFVATGRSGASAPVNTNVKIFVPLA